MRDEDRERTKKGRRERKPMIKGMIKEREMERKKRKKAMDRQ